MIGKKLYHGAAYYPELWPAEAVDEDIRLMRQVGITCVRVGEFAWSSMEPQEGQYAFDWLTRVLDKMAAATIGVVLCTPTPTPPVWLTERYPEVRYVDRDGVRHVHGARQHVCPTSPIFRDFSRKITEQLAKRFGKHPALIAWQTDNEFYCHNPNCCCENCRKAWHTWLAARYGTIEALNQAWNANIWSQTYQRFDQVPQPFRTPFLHNCSLETAYRQFGSDSIVAFQAEQVDIIRKHSAAPITHNTMPPWHPLDNDALFEKLDFCAVDVYMPTSLFWRAIREFDWMRSRKSMPYFLMETSPYQGGSTSAGHRPHPDGFLPAEAMLCYGLGGGGFSYWLWRQQRGGCEMCHGALLYSWGKPTLGWKNARAVSDAVAVAEPFLTAVPAAKAQLAIHYSMRSDWIFRTEPMEGGFSYMESWLNRVYLPVLQMGLYRDVIGEDAEVAGYRVVLSPMLPVVDQRLLRKMVTFVEGGGVWVVGPLSGYRTVEHTAHTDAGLGALEAAAGVRTLHSLGLTESAKANGLGQPTSVSGWVFSFEPRDAAVIGRYEESSVAGGAWLTERKIGKGRLILLGAAPQDEAYKGIVRHAIGETPLAQTTDASWGTVVAPREGNGRSGWVVVNWDGKGGSVTLPSSGVDWFGRKKVGGKLTLPPFGFALVEFGR